MRLPQDVLSKNYTKPRIFLCEANKERICQLETTNTNGTFKFNSYSEISFEVGRTYNDIITGETKVNEFYDKIEALRLIYIEGIGYFEIQRPELIGDGVKESKSVTAYSYEYTLSQKYLEDFYVNTGEVKSVEVINASSEDNIVPVTLYNPTNTKLSLLHLILEKDYAGWTIEHVDTQLQTLSRQFEIDRQSIYDFLMNEVCEKFNCYIVFDTIYNKISVYAESPTQKFISNGTQSFFIMSGQPFSEITQHEFAYRHSVYQNTDRIILSCSIGLTYGVECEIQAKMVENKEKRTRTQPITDKSAGSVFRRTEGVIPAALIDQAGLKGFSVGGACVSEKHAGFIVNRGGATAHDVLSLVEVVQQKIASLYGVELMPEIRYISAD